MLMPNQEAGIGGMLLAMKRFTSQQEMLAEQVMVDYLLLSARAPCSLAVALLR